MVFIPWGRVVAASKHSAYYDVCNYVYLVIGFLPYKMHAFEERFKVICSFYCDFSALECLIHHPVVLTCLLPMLSHWHNLPLSSMYLFWVRHLDQHFNGYLSFGAFLVLYLFLGEFLSISKCSWVAPFKLLGYDLIVRHHSFLRNVSPLPLWLLCTHIQKSPWSPSVMIWRYVSTDSPDALLFTNFINALVDCVTVWAL